MEWKPPEHSQHGRFAKQLDKEPRSSSEGEEAGPDVSAHFMPC
jgi:hypothetical protein